MDAGRMDSLFTFTQERAGITCTILVESSLLEEKDTLKSLEKWTAEVMILLLSKPNFRYILFPSNKPTLIFFYHGCVTEGVRMVVALLGRTLRFWRSHLSQSLKVFETQRLLFDLGDWERSSMSIILFSPTFLRAIIPSHLCTLFYSVWDETIIDKNSSGYI